MSSVWPNSGSVSHRREIDWMNGLWLPFGSECHGLPRQPPAICFQSRFTFVRRQRSEQNFTSSQVFDHLRRHVTGKEQTWQVFVGILAFLIIFAMASFPIYIGHRVRRVRQAHRHRASGGKLPRFSDRPASFPRPCGARSNRSVRDGGSLTIARRFDQGSPSRAH